LLRAVALCLAMPAAGQELVVGSKAFTESRLLAEILVQAIEAKTDLQATHKTIGGTLLCVEALRAGRIDLYPEYTGTGWAELLRETGAPGSALETFLTVQRRSRDELDLVWMPPLGLNNTYALAVRRETAERYGLTCISDLVATPQLRAGFSVEFVHRADGWAGLKPTYGLELEEVRTMEHALAYEALASGDLDLIDAYSTDAKLRRYDLRVLEDDRAFFPPYHAAPLVRGATLREHPELREVLEDLAFTLDDVVALELNHRVEVGGEAFADVARDFLAGRPLDAPAPRRRAVHGLAARALEHLWLSAISVLLAALVAIPLGITATRRPLLRRTALAVASVLQTIPSLALLAVLITLPGLGLDATTAVVALFLYALLPILRNTVAGLEAVDRELIDAAQGLGLTPREVLVRVQVPLAMGTLVAGVRTAAVISIGVATLAAFIGAGGLGELIVEGLYLNDPRLILAGAVPAAGLALLADTLLGRLERRLTPAGLRA
jgi:osmoprotectant transport system permease protein